MYTVEPRGDGAILTVKLGQELIRVDLAEELDFRPGDAIRLTLEKNRIHIFEKSSGKSLL